MIGDVQTGSRGEERRSRSWTVGRTRSGSWSSRTVAVADVAVEIRDGRARLTLRATEDVRLARWAAQRQSAVFEAAYGLGLDVVTDAPAAARP